MENKDLIWNKFLSIIKKRVSSVGYDTWFKAKLAGAENLEDVDSWLSDEEDQIVSRPNSNRIEF